jgi:hypothetical protein
MWRFTSMFVVLLVIMYLQAQFLKEAFGSSQGGAQVQLAASRPVYYVEAVPLEQQTGLLAI